MSQFEAALNLLREELRAVADTRRQILRDGDLERADPLHREQLLGQTMRELDQLSRAVGVLDRLQRGDLIEVVDPDQDLPVIGAWDARRSLLVTPEYRGAVIG